MWMGTGTMLVLAVPMTQLRLLLLLECQTLLVLPKETINAPAKWTLERH